MAETLGSLSLSIVSNSYSRDLSSGLEELSNSPLFSAETHVSTEDGVGFSSSSGSRTTRLGSVTRELNIKVGTIEFSSVSSGKSSSGLFVGVVLHEADGLLVEMLALNERSVCAEEFLKGFFVGVHGDASNEELGLTLILGVSGHSGGNNGSRGLLSGLILGLSFIGAAG